LLLPAALAGRLGAATGTLANTVLNNNINQFLFLYDRWMHCQGRKMNHHEKTQAADGRQAYPP
jgi:hypothetical protein